MAKPVLQVRKFVGDSMVTRKDLDTVRAKADKKDSTIPAGKFDGSVRVVHGDGSFFFIHDAFIEIEKLHDDEYLVVYAEHHRPMVFAVEELQQYHYYKNTTDGYNGWIPK